MYDWIAVLKGIPQRLRGKGSACHARDTAEPQVRSLGREDPPGKEMATHSRTTGSVPGSGRSPGEGDGNTLQDSCLEESMDRGVQTATVHGVAKKSDMT